MLDYSYDMNSIIRLITDICEYISEKLPLEFKSCRVASYHIFYRKLVGRKMEQDSYKLDQRYY